MDDDTIAFLSPEPAPSGDGRGRAPSPAPEPALVGSPTGPTGAESLGAMPGGRAVESREIRRAPSGGLPVWDTPDGTRAPIATLPAGTELTVVGRRGRWVHVTNLEGVDAWADGPQLAGVASEPGVAGVTARKSAAGSAGDRSSVVEKARKHFRISKGAVLGFAGSAAIGASGWLPWLQSTPQSTKQHWPGSAALTGQKIALSVLGGVDKFDEKTFALGSLILAIGIVAAVASMVRGLIWLRRIAGVVTIVLLVIFVLQFNGLVYRDGGGVGAGLNVWDVVSYGPLVAFAGSVVAIFAPNR